MAYLLLGDSQCRHILHCMPRAIQHATIAVEGGRRSVGVASFFPGLTSHDVLRKLTTYGLPVCPDVRVVFLCIGTNDLLNVRPFSATAVGQSVRNIIQRVLHLLPNCTIVIFSPPYLPPTVPRRWVDTLYTCLSDIASSSTGDVRVFSLRRAPLARDGVHFSSAVLWQFICHLYL